MTGGSANGRSAAFDESVALDADLALPYGRAIGPVSGSSSTAVKGGEK